LKNRTKDYIEDWEFDNGVWEKPTHPRVSFFFYMPIPKSMDRRTREKADTGKLIHVKKPDIDNLVKLYLDVISGIVIHDDNCVTIDQAVKIYSKNPKTVLVVTQGQEFYERDDGDDI
jgi:Holliday junction resolvase RusA-like endonuclease